MLQLLLTSRCGRVAMTTFVCPGVPMLLIFLVTLGVAFLVEDFLVLCEDGGERIQQQWWFKPYAL